MSQIFQNYKGIQGTPFEFWNMELHVLLSELFDKMFSITKNQHDNKFFEIRKWTKANFGIPTLDSDSATQNP